MSAGLCYDVRALPKKERCYKPKWRQWIQLIITTGGKFGLTKACIIKNSGDVLASVVGLAIGKQEFQELSNAFNQPTVDVIRIAGTTYCIKDFNSKQIIGFNGGKYLIITKSKTLLILCVCEDKNKLALAVAWLQRIGDSID